MGTEKYSEFYNVKFENSLDYHSHYKDSFYYVHWTQIIRFLKRLDKPKILEVGCGTGQLAHYLYDEGYKEYRGFDFSEKAIKIALQRVNLDFFVGNALEESSFAGVYDTIISTEVLEHIENDRKVLENIPIGKNIIFSVPNFDEVSHVRWFRSEREIKSRYFKLVRIFEIVRVGDIYIVRGERSNFKPNFLQSILASREEIKLSTFSKRFRHRIKNIFKLKEDFC